MRKNFTAYVIAVALLSLPLAGRASIITGINFAAPTINDKANVADPEKGAILLDTANDTFYGNIGSSSSPSWIPLAGQGTLVRSEIQITGGAGHGSINTAIRVFANSPLVETGSAITLDNDASSGASFTINENGLYSISYSDSSTSSTSVIGISKNSNQLTTSITSINDSNRVIEATAPVSHTPNCSALIYLQQGDVIRPHTNGNTNESSNVVKFIITKVSN